MIKGGYKIIDFKGSELSSTAVEVSGIYEQIVDNYDKAIMTSGVIISGELQDDAYASVKIADDSVTLTVYGGVITVTEDDEVTFASAKSNVELAEDIDDLQTEVNVLNNVAKYFYSSGKINRASYSINVSDILSANSCGFFAANVNAAGNTLGYFNLINGVATVTYLIDGLNYIDISYSDGVLTFSKNSGNSIRDIIVMIA